MQAGVADFEVAAPRCEHRRSGLELQPHPTAGGRGIGLRLFVGGQRGQHRVELGDPLALRGDVAGQSDRGSIEALELGLDRPAFALHPGERLGGGVEAGVVGVETARRARTRRRGRR